MTIVQMGEVRLKEFKGHAWEHTERKWQVLHSIPVRVISKPGRSTVGLGCLPPNELTPAISPQPADSE